ncbi:ACP S-malonyltransferase [bacterium]|nr:ACP S-malonyltransferase [bacterium]
MKKIAFVFPGQGSQYVGMGKDIYEGYKIVKETFDNAQKILGYNLSYLCFNGPKGKLNETIYTQIAVLVTSMAFLKVIKQERRELVPEVVAGHSLGEYTALFAAEVLNEQEVIEIVNCRARYMQQEAKKYIGGMAAILGMKREEVREICEDVKANCFKKREIIQVANLNCPLQVVISGTTEALNLAIDLAKERGSKRIVSLSVSGPFHSLAMKKVADNLSYLLKVIEFKTFKMPIVANFTGEYVQDLELMRRCLIEQVKSSVLWEDSIRNMIKRGINTFVEIGPGKILRDLINRIDNSVEIINVNNLTSLQKFIES